MRKQINQYFLLKEMIPKKEKGDINNCFDSM